MTTTPTMRTMRVYGGPLEGQTLQVAEGVGFFRGIDPETLGETIYDELECVFPQAGWSVRVLVHRGYLGMSVLPARIAIDYSCPECSANKHDGCNGETLNPDTDELVGCPCSATHEKEKEA